MLISGVTVVESVVDSNTKNTKTPGSYVVPGRLVTRRGVAWLTPVTYQKVVVYLPEPGVFRNKWTDRVTTRTALPVYVDVTVCRGWASVTSYSRNPVRGRVSR